MISNKKFRFKFHKHKKEIHQCIVLMIKKTIILKKYHKFQILFFLYKKLTSILKENYNIFSVCVQIHIYKQFFCLFKERHAVSPIQSINFFNFHIQNLMVNDPYTMLVYVINRTINTTSNGLRCVDNVISCHEKLVIGPHDARIML